jgi:signal transduction histidine kinase
MPSAAEPQRASSRRQQRVDWLPVVVALIGAAAVIVLWQALVARERESIRLASSAALDRVQKQIETRVESRVLVLVRTARRWEVRGKPPEEEWRADANLLVAHFGDFQRIEWIQPSLEPGWRVPSEPTPEVVGAAGAAVVSLRRKLLQQARDTRQICAAITGGPPRADWSLEVYVPVFQDSEFAGIIGGAHHLPRLLEKTLENVETAYGVAVLDGERLLFRRGETPAGARPRFAQEDDVATSGLRWRVRVWPERAALAAYHTAMPLLTLVGGLLMTLAVSTATRYARLSRWRALELETANQMLHEQIAERRQAEERARLHEAEIAHAARLRTMGELAAGLAHELNQPLCAIVSNACAAQRLLPAAADESSGVRDALADIAAEGQRAGEIIRRIRDFLRKRQAQPSPVALNAVIEEISGLLEFDAHHHAARVRFELTDGLPPAVADRIHVQQVVLNLARNGLESMDQQPSAARDLIIRTARDGAGTLVVSVCDRGAGMTTQAAARAGEPFFTTKPEGLGMGISISRSIVEAHGGRLWAVPNPDRGTTWHFTLPAASPNAAPRPGGSST